jgi:hypothetical protein
MDAQPVSDSAARAVQAVDVAPLGEVRNSIGMMHSTPSPLGRDSTARWRPNQCVTRASVLHQRDMTH